MTPTTKVPKRPGQKRPSSLETNPVTKPLFEPLTWGLRPKPTTLLLVLVLIVVMLALGGCTYDRHRVLYDGSPEGKMSLALVMDDPIVRADGYMGMFDLIPPADSKALMSIQDVDPHLGWVGREAHRQRMLIADFHSRSMSDPHYSLRDMRVRPGYATGVDWALWPKSVAMIDGWPGPDEWGRYRHNATYFRFYQMFPGARIVWEDKSAELHWRIEYFPAPSRIEQIQGAAYTSPRLRVSFPGTDVAWVWDRTGLIEQPDRITKDPQPVENSD